MNVVDIILLVCFVPGIIRGLSKGFMVQACTLVGFVASVWCAWKFASLLGTYLAPHLSLSPALINTIAFTIILIIISILFTLLGKLLRKLMKVIMLGWLDKLLGAVLALLVTLAILGVVILIFNSLDTQWHIIKSDILEKSALYQGIKNIALAVFPYLKQLFTSESAPVQETACLLINHPLTIYG